MAVVTVDALHAGQANHVIPASAVLEISVRAMDSGIRTLLEQRIRALVDATGYGVVARLDWRPGYAVPVNTPAETELARQVALDLVGPERVKMQAAALPASEDFAFLLEKVPGSYLQIGNGNAPGGCMVHHPGYDFHDGNIVVGSAYWVRLAERFLSPRQPPGVPVPAGAPAGRSHRPPACRCAGGS